MALVLRDEFLEDTADNIIAKFGEIILLQYRYQLFYFRDNLFLVRKGNGINKIGSVDSFVVYFEDFIKEALQYLLKLCPFG